MEKAVYRTAAPRPPPPPGPSPEELGEGPYSATLALFTCLTNIAFAGVTLIHQMHGRWVERYPGDIAVQCGRHICLDESSALKLAREAGVPTPRMDKAERTADGVCRIHMDFVPGQTLDKQKEDVVRQLREILTAMRAQKPPAQTPIGTCNGGEVRDLRVYSHYTAGPFDDEEAFNKGTVLDLLHPAPTVLREAFA
ncbi:MAG: hypothetical protein M4579_007582, partial [Chaenotheca gracillima]